ncbi:hypothetical protein lbkm_3881 [Lachnospiraceae bacterium KM106-2]|nr:hypothetical protein lbkm_3881 [Lachnospiraceae bacterium KM106-2]
MEDFKWKIGEYEFHTKEGYMEGLQDMKKIAKIKGTIDVHNADMAKQIYRKLQARQIFHTQIGADFIRSLKETIETNDQLIASHEVEEETEKIYFSSGKIHRNRMLVAGVITLTLLIGIRMLYTPEKKKIKQAAEQFVTSFYDEKDLNKTTSYMTDQYKKDKLSDMKQTLSYIKNEVSYQDISDFKIISNDKKDATIHLVLKTKKNEKEDQFVCKIRMKKISDEWQVSYFGCDS